MHTVFYSWQSDIKAAANRSLIQDALELAIQDVHDPEGKPIINPAIDRDTVGVPGAPDISTTILEKIDNSSVIVADITLVDDGSQGRRFPNPNVLIEVGYAIKSLGFSRILLIQNTFNGNIEDLPFDIRSKRVMTYCSYPNDNSRTDQRKQLSKQIKTALIAILPVLNDVLSEENSEQIINENETREEIETLYREFPDDIEDKLDKIANKIDSSPQTLPEIRTRLIYRLVELGRSNPKISKEFLYKLNERSIKSLPTASGFFNKGYLAGLVGKPYDSIGAYMKAIELDDPNPSLCFLNAGNRYRDLNDFNIALAFYAKSVELNPKQANAWLAGAQLSEQIGDTESAKRYYLGFLDWFNGLSEVHKNESRRQQALQAQNYIDSH
jgi:tetratricopeptide (TPR) repeat protein